MLEQKLRNLPRKLNLLEGSPITTLEVLHSQSQPMNNFPLMGTGQSSISSKSNEGLGGMVRLRDCDPAEIIHFTKNRVIKQSIIKVPVMAKPNLTEAFKAPFLQKQQPKENEQLFNYQKLEKEKHERKKKFLSGIEKKINDVQQEAFDLEQQFKAEGEQIQEIENLHSRINTQFHSQNMVEKISQLQKEIEEDDLKKAKNKIELDMEVDQIKRVIEAEAELDRRVIDEADDLINRLRPQHKTTIADSQKTKQKPSKSSSKLATSTTSFLTTKKVKH